MHTGLPKKHIPVGEGVLLADGTRMLTAVCGKMLNEHHKTRVAGGSFVPAWDAKNPTCAHCMCLQQLRKEKENEKETSNGKNMQ